MWFLYFPWESEREKKRGNIPEDLGTSRKQEFHQTMIDQISILLPLKKLMIFILYCVCGDTIMWAQKIREFGEFDYFREERTKWCK